MFLSFARLIIALGQIEATHDANQPAAMELTKGANEQAAALPMNWIDRPLFRKRLQDAEPLRSLCT
jgi:hypothetical protein